MKLGIDFGTTNSAVAVLRPDGAPQIVELLPGERIQRSVIHCTTDGRVSFGNEAFRQYLDSDLSGRFLRSLKAFLPHDVPPTTLGRTRYTFPELISSYLSFLVDRATDVLGEPVDAVVVGRPVRFHADPKLDEAARQRLVTAVEAADVGDYKLQFEPVAAAYRYEHGLAEERVVLVGDFGGGTSDFAVLRVGPRRARDTDRGSDILATSGVAKAGNALDAVFMDTFLMEFFGRGAKYRKRYTQELIPWNHPIHREIQRLHYLHFLKDHQLLRTFDWLEQRLTDPVAIRRLRRLIFDDLGFPMAWAIEGTKRQFSSSAEATFRFDEFYDDTLDMACSTDRDTFAHHARTLLAEYDAAIDRALADAGLASEDIDDVFLTGGTSQLPFVRALFAGRFGGERLHGADAFTSVCEGLALAN